MENVDPTTAPEGVHVSNPKMDPSALISVNPEATAELRAPFDRTGIMGNGHGENGSECRTYRTTVGGDKEETSSGAETKDGRNNQESDPGNVATENGDFHERDAKQDDAGLVQPSEGHPSNPIGHLHQSLASAIHFSYLFADAVSSKPFNKESLTGQDQQALGDSSETSIAVSKSGDLNEEAQQAAHSNPNRDTGPNDGGAVSSKSNNSFDKTNEGDAKTSQDSRNDFGGNDTATNFPTDKIYSTEGQEKREQTLGVMNESLSERDAGDVNPEVIAAELNDAQQECRGNVFSTSVDEIVQNPAAMRNESREKTQRGGVGSSNEDLTSDKPLPIQILLTDCDDNGSAIDPAEYEETPLDDQSEIDDSIRSNKEGNFVASSVKSDLESVIPLGNTAEAFGEPTEKSTTSEALLEKSPADAEVKGGSDKLLHARDSDSSGRAIIRPEAAKGILFADLDFDPSRSPAAMTPSPDREPSGGTQKEGDADRNGCDDFPLAKGSDDESAEGFVLLFYVGRGRVMGLSKAALSGCCHIPDENTFVNPSKECNANPIPSSEPMTKEGQCEESSVQHETPATDGFKTSHADKNDSIDEEFDPSTDPRPQEHLGSVAVAGSNQPADLEKAHDEMQPLFSDTMPFSHGTDTLSGDKQAEILIPLLEQAGVIGDGADAAKKFEADHNVRYAEVPLGIEGNSKPKEENVYEQTALAETKLIQDEALLMKNSMENEKRDNTRADQPPSEAANEPRFQSDADETFEKLIMTYPEAAEISAAKINHEAEHETPTPEKSGGDIPEFCFDIESSEPTTGRAAGTQTADDLREDETEVKTTNIEPRDTRSALSDRGGSLENPSQEVSREADQLGSVFEANSISPRFGNIDGATRKELADYDEDQLQDRVSRVIEVFIQNGQNTIGVSEVGTIIRCLGMNPTESQIDRFVQKLSPREGAIDSQVFSILAREALRSGKYAPVPEEELAEAFKVFDEDASGMISLEELNFILTSFGEPLTEDEYARFVEFAENSTEDGFVNYSQFVKKLCDVK